MQALRVIYALWLREVKLFLRERSRIVGMIGQPLLYLLIFGQGIASALQFTQSPGVNYVLFLYPGILGMSVLFTSIFSGISIIWDRQFGFLKEVLVAPAPRWAVAGGKILGGSTVTTVQSAILLLLAPLAGVYPSPLMVLELLLLCFLLSCAMTSLGVAIAARMRSMQGFQMVMNFLVMPLYFLSGAVFPVSSAPDVLKTLMVLDPLTYGVDALRVVVLSGTTAGASLPALLLGNLYTDVAVMVLVAVVLAGVAALSFSRME
jgi:ABC-2 type transport system permease protein